MKTDLTTRGVGSCTQGKLPQVKDVLEERYFVPLLDHINMYRFISKHFFLALCPFSEYRSTPVSKAFLNDALLVYFVCLIVLHL